MYTFYIIILKDPIKLFSVAKFLDTSVKSFFPFYENYYSKFTQIS